jgi:hypothetical protein
VLEGKLSEERRIRAMLDEEYRKLVSEISDMKSKVQRDLKSEYQGKLDDLQYDLAVANDKIRQQSEQRSMSVDRVRIPAKSDNLAEKWKNKATTLVTKYYDALKNLRKE